MMIYALDCVRIMYGWCLNFPLRILFERTDDHPELKPTYKYGHLTKILSQVPDTVDLKSSPPNSNAPSSRWRSGPIHFKLDQFIHTIAQPVHSLRKVPHSNLFGGNILVFF